MESLLTDSNNSNNINKTNNINSIHNTSSKDYSPCPDLLHPSLRGLCRRPILRTMLRRGVLL
jgi:hypothetical protein